ncbi:hypothetical protein BC829DRAFT_92631 [Chytridium lagenaria]|nr:hypothetical protein BC829DRAFT_92631 [Chytridium lagenaria]
MEEKNLDFFMQVAEVVASGVATAAATTAGGTGGAANGKGEEKTERQRGRKRGAERKKSGSGLNGQSSTSLGMDLVMASANNVVDPASNNQNVQQLPTTSITSTPSTAAADHGHRSLRGMGLSRSPQRRKRSDPTPGVFHTSTGALAVDDAGKFTGIQASASTTLEDDLEASSLAQRMHIGNALHASPRRKSLAAVFGHIERGSNEAMLTPPNPSESQPASGSSTPQLPSPTHPSSAMNTSQSVTATPSSSATPYAAPPYPGFYKNTLDTTSPDQSILTGDPSPSSRATKRTPAPARMLKGLASSTSRTLGGIVEKGKNVGKGMMRLVTTDTPQQGGPTSPVSPTTAAALAMAGSVSTQGPMMTTGLPPSMGPPILKMRVKGGEGSTTDGAVFTSSVSGGVTLPVSPTGSTPINAFGIARGKSSVLLQKRGSMAVGSSSFGVGGKNGPPSLSLVDLTMRRGDGSKGSGSRGNMATLDDADGIVRESPHPLSDEDASEFGTVQRSGRRRTRASGAESALYRRAKSLDLSDMYLDHLHDVVRSSPEPHDQNETITRKRSREAPLPNGVSFSTEEGGSGGVDAAIPRSRESDESTATDLLTGISTLAPTPPPPSSSHVFDILPISQIRTISDLLSEYELLQSNVGLHAILSSPCGLTILNLMDTLKLLVTKLLSAEDTAGDTTTQLRALHWRLDAAMREREAVLHRLEKSAAALILAQRSALGRVETLGNATMKARYGVAVLESRVEEAEESCGAFLERMRIAEVKVLGK